MTIVYSPAAVAALLAALLASCYQGWDETWFKGVTGPAVPSAADELLQTGRVAAAQQRWEDARSAFLLADTRLSVATEASTENNEAKRRTQFLIGYADARLGRHAEAVIAYQRAVSTSPVPAAELHWNMALSLKELARLEEAAEHFGLAAAYAAAPGNPIALFQQGRALESLGRVAEAVDGPLRSATVIAGQKGGSAATDTDYPVALGLALASIGRNTEAAAAFSDAIEMTHNIPHATGSMELGGVLINLGNVLHAMDRLNEAAHTYKQAVDVADAVQLEAAEALAATLTVLEQRVAAESEQAETGMQQVHDTAALWVERAASIGRAQQAYYAGIIELLPSIAGYAAEMDSRSGGREDALSTGPTLTMNVLRSSDFALNHRGDVGVGPIGGLGVIRGLASDADCDAIVALARSAGMAAATVDSGVVDTSLRRSSSVSLPHWRSDPAATRVVSRLAGLLRVPLDAVAAAVELHVGHYAAAETYPAHHDASATTRRWVTLLLYLSDHRSHDTGGHTVFGTRGGNSDADLRAVCSRVLQQGTRGRVVGSPSDPTALSLPVWRVEDGEGVAGVAYRGERGGGLLWSNYVQEHGAQQGSAPKIGDLDDRARHSGCEVKEGQKWVLNVWVRLGPSFGRLAGLE